MMEPKLIYVTCIKLFTQQCGQSTVSLMKKQVCLYRKKIMKVRAFERYIPFNEWLPIASLPRAREKDGIWEVNVTN